ncbi:MAG: bifunctional hexulose-6-phosphate synthase/ribonuclease regulator [Methanomicrobiales archaeon]|nr:bifunctional hexulose-6-phosphate synthase/ribonuclease regulator [Methanomicrobiales archaeon]
MDRPVLQVALDLLELPRALQIAEEALTGGVDWLEAGTPLIKSEGMAAITALRKRFPDRVIVADMKVADTGALEIEMAAKAGASVVTVLSNADDAVILESVRAARLYGVKIMVDLINEKNPVKRGLELEGMGIDYLIAHTGIDQQMMGADTLSPLGELRKAISIPMAVAGGLNAEMAANAVRMGANIVIVGSSITRSSDVTGSAARIRRAMEAIEPPEVPRLTLNEEIRSRLEQVSTPNISDAMHRKGAMTGLFPICRGMKMIGPAVTVQTFAGDWAKPVEAIDLAGRGEVIVINNDAGVHVAPWGGLATLSCTNRGLAGVVIDGAVRDAEEIRRIGFPVYARAIVPNAGEPKGFGEINTEITCCGQIVKPGDWIVGDDNGVVVIPAERAYEVARRAMEVKRNEDRIKEEIRRGGTLAKIMDLLKWEKK